MLIIPPRAQINFDSIVKTGPFPKIIVGAKGIQGAGGVGTQGVPKLERQTPKLITFNIGIKSNIVKAGLFDTNTFEIESKGEGATPPVHIAIPPITTIKPIIFVL